MKVFVVYDTLYEKVMAVFKNESDADRYCYEKNIVEDRYKGKSCYLYNNDEFEVIEWFTLLGVSIKNGNGEYRNLSEVINDLQHIWDNK
jgi:hypothetical protein